MGSYGIFGWVEVRLKNSRWKFVQDIGDYSIGDYYYREHPLSYSDDPVDFWWILSDIDVYFSDRMVIDEIRMLPEDADEMQVALWRDLINQCETVINWATLAEIKAANLEQYESILNVDPKVECFMALLEKYAEIHGDDGVRLILCYTH